MTSQLEALDSTDRFDGEVVALGELLDGQVLVSQDRCVDALLDLFNAAPTEVVRRLIADVLDEIRHLSAVKAEDLRAKLDELAAAAAVEGAFFT